jgi:hypothetical protein
LIQKVIWIVDRAGQKNTGESELSSRNLLHFIPGQWTSAHPAEYPVVVFIRHKFLLFQSSPNILGEQNLSKRLVLQSGRQLCIKALVWIAGRAGYKDAQTSWNQTARDTEDFMLLQWAGSRPAKYPVIVVVRHRLLLSSSKSFSKQAGESICRDKT